MNITTDADRKLVKAVLAALQVVREEDAALMLALVRNDAIEEGRWRERAEIVAWLYAQGRVPGAPMPATLADVIRAGAHRDDADGSR